MIAQSPNGAGKTACFVMAGLQTICQDEANIQVIIISPTRELTRQNHKATCLLASQSKIACAMLLKENSNQLPEGQILNCTPGVLNKILRGRKAKINVNKIKMIIFDEADTQFDANQGFAETTDSILQSINRERKETGLIQ